DRLLAEFQTLQQTPQPFVGKRLTRRLADSPAQHDRQDREYHDRQDQHCRGPPRQQECRQDRCPGSHTAWYDDEENQISKKHHEERRRSLNRDSIRNHHRTSQQQEAPTRKRDRLHELVGENPVRRRRGRQQIRGLPRLKQPRVHDDARREEQHHQKRQKE